MKNNQFSPFRNRKNAFTLIELLVVIAIIAILAAILFPVFGRARENARRSSCQSNLKQIGLGIFQYTQDYDETYPLSAINQIRPPVSTVPIGWADVIQPYLKSTQIYQCPSETNPPPTNANPLLIPASNGYTDYWFNKTLGVGNVPLAGVLNPTLSIMVGEGGTNDGTVNTNSNASYRNNGCQSSGTIDRNNINCGAYVGLATNLGGGGIRHLEGGNYAFVDGHVKWLKNPNNNNNSGSKIWSGSTGFTSTTPSSGNDPTMNITIQ